MDTEQNNTPELISAESFKSVMKRVRKNSNLALAYNVLGTIAIFVFAIIFLSMADDGLLVPGLIFLAGGVLQLIHTVNFRKYVASTEEIEELPGIMDAVESHRAPSLRRYLRFTKDGKWGVYDVTLHRILLEPVYDRITWKKTGSTLLVSADGTQQLVKIGRFKDGLEFQNL